MDLVRRMQMQMRLQALQPKSMIKLACCRRNGSSIGLDLILLLSSSNQDVQLAAASVIRDLVAGIPECGQVAEAAGE